jgi:hypothetical protein
LRKLRSNRKGIMYLISIFIISLIALPFFWYMAAAVVQGVQENTASALSSDKWYSTQNYDIFNLAVTFINNFWMFYLGFVVFGLLYFGYYYAQRRGREV